MRTRTVFPRSVIWNDAGRGEPNSWSCPATSAGMTTARLVARATARVWRIIESIVAVSVFGSP